MRLSRSHGLLGQLSGHTGTYFHLVWWGVVVAGSTSPACGYKRLETRPSAWAKGLPFHRLRDELAMCCGF